MCVSQLLHFVRLHWNLRVSAVRFHHFPHFCFRMTSPPPTRSGKTTIGFSIVLLLIAMLLPVCHIHSPLDKTAPDHCTICISLHAAAPIAAHIAPAPVLLLPFGRVAMAASPSGPESAPRFTASRAPPPA